MQNRYPHRDIGIAMNCYKEEKTKYSMSYFNYSSKDLLKSEIETIYSMFIAHVK